MDVKELAEVMTSQYENTTDALRAISKLIALVGKNSQNELGENNSLYLQTISIDLLLLAKGIDDKKVKTK